VQAIKSVLGLDRTWNKVFSRLQRNSFFEVPLTKAQYHFKYWHLMFNGQTTVCSETHFNSWCFLTRANADDLKTKLWKNTLWLTDYRKAAVEYVTILDSISISTRSADELGFFQTLATILYRFSSFLCMMTYGRQHKFSRRKKHHAVFESCLAHVFFMYLLLFLLYCNEREKLSGGVCNISTERGLTKVGANLYVKLK